ncbi:MAG: rRNA maturation RNase YbeY [Candidatus Krumholzibacteria bacterium]|nr:rRNA maturation RNase YbeY [Candidatus Krumholzibacteria bacterium]
MKIRIGSRPTVTGRSAFERAAPRMAEVAARVDGAGRPVEVTLVGERRMAALNGRYKGRRGAAEMLTFDYGTGRGASPEDPRGEILICWKRLEAGARSRGVSPGAYLLRLLAHGLCHLAGRSHGTDLRAARMEAAERRALEGIVSRRDIERLF